MGPAPSAHDKGRCQLPSKPHHMGRRLAHEGAHSGRRDFKPKIPSESKDNYLRALTGNSSARTGQATGEKDPKIQPLNLFRRLPVVLQ